MHPVQAHYCLLSPARADEMGAVVHSSAVREEANMILTCHGIGSTSLALHGYKTLLDRFNFKAIGKADNVYRSNE